MAGLDSLRPVTETPEFLAAMAKFKEDLLNELSAKQPAPAGASTEATMDALAMAIATLNDQGTGRRRFSPQTVKKWAEAQERMFALIRAARVEGRPATYQVIAKTLLADNLLSPFWADDATHKAMPTEIDWAGVPNMALAPLNDTAKEIYAAYKDSIDLVGKEVPDFQKDETDNKIMIRGKRIPKARETVMSFGMNIAEESTGLSVKHKSSMAGQTMAKNVLGSIAPPIQVPAA